MTAADLPETQGAVIPFYRDERKISILAQVIFVVIVAALGIWLIGNMLNGLEQSGISSGFSFLDDEARFPIAVAGDLIPYSPENFFAYAFVVGLFNTIIVALAGIVLATVLGVATGIARLSGNWLINQIASIYIGLVRNTPLVVQLVLWYTAVILKLPLISDSVNFINTVLVSKRGTALPAVTNNQGAGIFWVFLMAGLVAAYFVNRWRNQNFEATGEAPRNLLWAGGTFLIIAVAGWFIAGGAPVSVTMPAVNEAGNKYIGFQISPEYTALVLGLAIYTATFIAEIVRAGVQSVSKGQVEAARALGLTGGQSMRLIIFPQALRVIIPPLTSQYLNLTKNSSLAAIIGFQDLFSVVRTITNQSGNSVEGIGMMMGTYLILSLLTSSVLNWYNKRIQLVER